MIVGIDFDNTIVSYDELFWQQAIQQNLLTGTIPLSKIEVREILRTSGREDDWTELQGYVYGPGIIEARPFAGVKEFFRTCHRQGIEIYIISHKTQTPFRGPQYDLHRHALNWLEAQGFHDDPSIALHRSRVFLEPTRESKLQRIATTRCTHFIDDLPEFLAEPLFPRQTHKLLFDPNGHYMKGDVERFDSWRVLADRFKS